MKRRRGLSTFGWVCLAIVGVAIAVVILSQALSIRWMKAYFYLLVAGTVITAQWSRVRRSRAHKTKGVRGRHDWSAQETVERFFGHNETYLLFQAVFFGAGILLGIVHSIRIGEYRDAAFLAGMTGGGVLVVWLLTKRSKPYTTRARRRREAAGEAKRELDKSAPWADE